MRLLLVEDDTLNIELVEAALDGDGHTLVVERDGKAGLERGLHDAFDLIVLDIHLPGMRGDDVCAALRVAGIRTPIVAFSASAMEHEIAGVRSAGFDAYLTKPIRATELRRSVLYYAAMRPAAA